MKIAELDKLILPLALLSVTILTYLLYLPGLQGGFLFDDYPNLKELGTYGGVTDFETFKNFVFNGISSPLGRPLSLASFLLDDNTWPSHAEWFKATNIKIHLITGLSLCLATLYLMRLFGFDEKKAAWVALLSASIWMLHPYMVSTTLYVVQRMAQLAAMFVFMGLAGYFYGRILLVRKKVVAAYVWMSISLGLATLLALLSKENGVLLPIMVIAIEFCLPQSLPRLNIWWKALFLWVPCLTIFVVLAKKVNFSPDAWPSRLFTQPERLLTEPRIIWEYLYHLYIPRIEGRGLFQDGYPFSRGLFQPVTTFFSLFGLIVLIAVSVFFRKHFPYFSLSILFFFAAHLLESTVIALELYFEHRNYLSSAFLFLPIAIMLMSFSSKGWFKASLISALLLITVLSFLTWQRTNLWANTKKLEMYWAASTPESPRAQNKIGVTLLSMGRLDDAILHMERSVERFPNSSLLVVNNLLMKVYAGRASEMDFVEASKKMKLQPFDAQAVMGLRNLSEKVSGELVDDSYRRFTLRFLDDVKTNKNFNNVYSFKKLIPYLKGLIYLGSKEYELAYEQFSIAIPMYRETDAALSMVALMANADRPVEAYMLFKQAENVFRDQPDKTLKRSRELYNSEFKRMEGMLDEHLKVAGIKIVDKLNSESKQ